MNPLADRDKDELLALARATLESYLAHGSIPQYHTNRPELRARCGAFVTLHRGGDLRGCIGHIGADRELFRVVQQCAVSAAAEDSRFVPVRAEELPDLTIEISVLTPFQKIRDARDVQAGRHGLFVARGSKRGLLLPQVATQYGWDRETFLSQTCRKAGLPLDAWQDPETSIQVFEAQVFTECHP